MRIRDKFAAWFAPESAGPGDDFWYQDVAQGAIRTPMDALQVSAVYRCVDFLATLVAGLPLQVYRRNPSDDGRTVAREHPLYSVIHDQANDYYTAFEFWEAVMWSLMLRGNALAEVLTNARNDVYELRLLDWSRVTVHRDQQTKVRVFKYTMDDGQQKMYTDSDVLYIPGPGYDGTKSPSPIELHAANIGISKTAQQYVLNYFHRGALPPAYLSFPQDVGEKKLTEWADWFRKKFMGRNSGTLGVVPSGGKIETVSLHHREMQLVELRQFQIAEACRIWGIPPHLVQDLSRATNNNIEHQGIDVARYTAKPWTKRIENRCNVTLLGPKERSLYFCEFNLLGLTEGDSQAQAALMAAEIQHAGLTPNEWRAIRNRPPKPGGDDLYMQGAMVRLQDLPDAGEQTETEDEVTSNEA